MKKYFPYISSLILTFVLIFVVSGFLFPQTAQAQLLDPASFGFGWVNSWDKIVNFAADALLAPFGWTSILLLQIAALITDLSGAILNFAVRYSILDMTKFVSGASVVNDAWSTIRDLANMGFIFILLYAAIQTILGVGSDTKKLIVNVIVVAILINFSLFFTKLVIDASNVLAIFFYDIIAPGTLGTNATTGLSGQLMQPLRLTSLWDIRETLGPGEVGKILLSGKKLIIVGIMGTIVSLIAAFVFFAVAIMFVIRFVVLIFVLILSPIAFMAFVLPALKSHGDKWKDALIGQAFFAPIYFMLTWIVLVVSKGLPFSNSGTLANAFLGTVGTNGETIPPTSGSIEILVNFIVMIVFLIASLIIAKDWANKAPGGVSKLTSWAMGAAGGATIGMAGRFGRGTVGRAGQAIAENEWLKDKASTSRLARLGLATSRKTAGASFDVRGIGALSALEAGKAGGKGGFADFRKKQAEAAEKTAKAMGPSEATLDQAEQAVKRAATDGERRVAQARLDQLKGVDDARAKEMLRNRGWTNARVKSEEGKEEIVRLKKAMAGEGSKRKQAYAQVMENSYWAKARGYNLAAAAQIRRGKSKEKKLAEAYKDITKDEEPETETPETSPSIPTPPTEGTPTT